MLSCPHPPGFRFTSLSDPCEHCAGFVVGRAGTKLHARQVLHRGDVIWRDLQSCAAGDNRVSSTASPVERESEVETRLRVPGDQLACPLKLRRGFIETAFLQQQYTKVVVRGPAVQIVRERTAHKRFSEFGVAGQVRSRFAVQALCLDGVTA